VEAPLDLLRDGIRLALRAVRAPAAQHVDDALAANVGDTK